MMGTDGAVQRDWTGRYFEVGVVYERADGRTIDGTDNAWFPS